MENLDNKPLSRFTGSAIPALLRVLLLSLLVVLPLSANADDDYQLRMLFKPTPNQLKLESRGRVMIYDRLHNSVIERALDEQFGRIQHMMFIRTRHTQESGEESEDDDC